MICRDGTANELCVQWRFNRLGVHGGFKPVWSFFASSIETEFNIRPRSKRFNVMRVSHNAVSYVVLQLTKTEPAKHSKTTALATSSSFGLPSNGTDLFQQVQQARD